MSTENVPSPERETPLDESSPFRVKRRFKLAQALTEIGYENVKVLSAESADRALTPTRREIINTVARHDLESQNELAELLDRDPGNVKRDLAVLIDEGLLEREKNGNSYRPILKYDTILSEPLPLPVE